MRIGIVGAGLVGMSLARGLARAGHAVALGTSAPDKPTVREWIEAAGARGRVEDYRAAVEHGDVVIMAVPGRNVVEIAEKIGPGVFSGKVVIDPTNPVAFTDGEVVSAYPEDDSAAEALQRLLPGARVVKALNQIDAGIMTDPPAEEKRPLRIAGDDILSKTTVTALFEPLGWKVHDLGPLKRARPLERGVIEWIARNA